MTTTNSDTTRLDINTNTHLSTSGYSYTIRPTRPADVPYLPDVERSAAALFASIPGLSHLADDDSISVEAHREGLERWKEWRLSVGDENGKLEGGSWVVVAHRDEHTVGDDEEIVGFVVTDLLPIVHKSESHVTQTEIETTNPESYFLHINELSIHTSHQRRGLARRLLSTIKDFAVTLSTHHYPLNLVFRDGFSDADHRAAAEDSEPRLRTLGLSLTTFQNVPFNAPFYEKFEFREVERGDIEGVVGVEGMRIWREDCARFEREGGGELEMRRRCWMVCWL